MFKKHFDLIIRYIKCDTSVIFARDLMLESHIVRCMAATVISVKEMINKVDDQL